MARHKKLTARVVKAIFLAPAGAAETALKHKVSQNLVYLIRARRIHKAITEGLRSPRRATRRRRSDNAAPRLRIDMNRLADAISKRVVKQLVDRLRGKG